MLSKVYKESGKGLRHERPARVHLLYIYVYGTA